jgi:hypothetical protein
MPNEENAKILFFIPNKKGPIRQKTSHASAPLKEMRDIYYLYVGEGDSAGRF